MPFVLRNLCVGASVLLTASAASAAAVTFDGGVTTAACTVSVGTEAGLNPVVTLPTISVADLPTDGATFGETVFFIQGTQCTGAKQVELYFDQTQANSFGRLPSGVAGVDLQILTGNACCGPQVNLAANAGSQGVFRFPSFYFNDITVFQYLFTVRYFRNSPANLTAVGAVNVPLKFVAQYF